MYCQLGRAALQTQLFCQLGRAALRVSSKQTKINFGSNRNKPKQDLFRVCFGLFRFVSLNQKEKVSVCFGVSNLYRNNRNKQICFVINRNNPKFSEKFPNILSFKLCGWVFRFNQNSLFQNRSETTETNFSKQTEKNEKNEKKLKKPKNRKNPEKNQKKPGKP